MFNKLKVFIFCVFSLSFHVYTAVTPYENSWQDYSSVDEALFHRRIASRLTLAKVHLDSLDKQSNIAAFALRITTTNKTTHTSDSVIIDFPNLFYSAYNVSEDKPAFEPRSGVQIIAVPDLFRGDVISYQTKKHRLCDFCFWLASKEHAAGWGLENEIASDAEIIKKGNASEMSQITAPGQKRNSLQSVLHCEQLFIYKLLTDKRLLKDMIDRLFSNPEIDNVLDTNHTDVRFILEICTYNDMCPKCFSSCFNLYRELLFSISEKFFKKLSTNIIFKQYSDILKIPFPLEIHISSFRPFFMQTGKLTRLYARNIPNNYTEFSLFQPTKPFKNNGRIIQFFNPWVAQHIFNYEVENFIASMQHLGTAKFYDEWNLLRKFSKLIETKQIETPIINEITTKLLAQKDVFVRPDICCYILPFSIELAKQITEHKDEFHNFIRDIAIKSNINDKSLAQLIEDLNKIPNPTDIIRLAINDQQMKLNTLLLLESSKKNPSGYYDFKNMIDASKKISLKDGHPTIVSFIRTELKKLLNIPSQENWRTLPSGYIQLQGILQRILQ